MARAIKMIRTIETTRTNEMAGTIFKLSLSLRLVILIFFVFLSVSVHAQEGCFTYQESPFYCSKMGIEQAEEECFLFDGCFLDKFFAAKDCAQLLECNKVLCKSACRETFLGNCASGEVPAGEEQEWCLPGCCSFSSGNLDFCQFMANKWSCEIEGSNKGVRQVSFDSDKDNRECSAFCSLAGEERVSEEISSGKIVAVSETAQKVEQIGSSEKNLSAQTIAKDREITAEQKGSTNLVWIFLIIFFMIIGYYLFKKKLDLKMLLHLGEKTPSAKQEKLLSGWLSPFRSNPFVREKIRKMKVERNRKMKIKDREEFFAAHGLRTQPPQDHFSRLESISKHQIRQQEIGQKVKKEAPFRKLERISSQQQRSQRQKTKPEQERKDVFSYLNEISQKK